MTALVFKRAGIRFKKPRWPRGPKLSVGRQIAIGLCVVPVLFYNWCLMPLVGPERSIICALGMTWYAVLVLELFFILVIRMRRNLDDAIYTPLLIASSIALGTGLFFLYNWFTLIASAGLEAHNVRNSTTESLSLMVSFLPMPIMPILWLPPDSPPTEFE